MEYHCLFMHSSECYAYWLMSRENVYGVLDWQRVGARLMVQHYLDADIILHVCIVQYLCMVLCYFIFFNVSSHYFFVILYKN